jgi:hypothetical protein
MKVYHLPELYDGTETQEQSLAIPSMMLHDDKESAAKWIIEEIAKMQRRSFSSPRAETLRRFSWLATERGGTYAATAWAGWLLGATGSIEDTTPAFLNHEAYAESGRRWLATSPSLNPLLLQQFAWLWRPPDDKAVDNARSAPPAEAGKPVGETRSALPGPPTGDRDHETKAEEEQPNAAPEQPNSIKREPAQGNHDSRDGDQDQRTGVIDRIIGWTRSHTATVAGGFIVTAITGLGVYYAAESAKAAKEANRTHNIEESPLLKILPKIKPEGGLGRGCSNLLIDVDLENIGRSHAQNIYVDSALVVGPGPGEKLCGPPHRMTSIFVVKPGSTEPAWGAPQLEGASTTPTSVNLALCVTYQSPLDCSTIHIWSNYTVVPRTPEIGARMCKEVISPDGLMLMEAPHVDPRLFGTSRAPGKCDDDSQ